MASINDVFNQLVAVNGKLGQIEVNTANETVATNQVNASVGTLDTDLKAGFAATVNALQTIIQLDVDAVQLLLHLTQQADTMICVLEHISQNTCGILNQATLQTQLQTRIRDDADALRDIAESAYPAGALERERLAALRAQIEQCCPPPQAQPPCAYEPCPKPRPPRPPRLPQLDDQPAS